VSSKFLNPIEGRNLVMIAFPHPRQMCWICGKLVELETCKTDEHGNAVHERCYAAKMALSREAQMSSKKPPNAMPQMAKMPSARVSDSMPEVRCPEWQKAYQAALLETEHSRLKQKILDAEAAILKRRQELSRGAPHAGTSLLDGAAAHAELMKISDALSSLNTLRNELQKGASQK
jgi:hypothetical protein